MRIRMTDSVAGATWCWAQGTVQDLPQFTASRLIAQGVAVRLDDEPAASEVETAVDPQQGELAVEAPEAEAAVEDPPPESRGDRTGTHKPTRRRGKRS